MAEPAILAGEDSESDDEGVDASPQLQQDDAAAGRAASAVEAALAALTGDGVSSGPGEGGGGAEYFDAIRGQLGAALSYMAQLRDRQDALRRRVQGEFPDLQADSNYMHIQSVMEQAPAYSAKVQAVQQRMTVLSNRVLKLRQAAAQLRRRMEQDRSIQQAAAAGGGEGSRETDASVEAQPAPELVLGGTQAE